MKWIVFAFSLWAMASFGGARDLPSASLIDAHVRSLRQKSEIPWVSSERRARLTQGTFSQPIDHLGKISGNFGQRYWMDSQYASPSANAPVLYHICGEGDAEQGYFLNDNAIDWAKKLGAHIVYLEHRYYGKSLPFPDLTAEHLQYLTLNNIIEDLATFQRWIAQEEQWKGRWIVIGGSYSGTLSAIYRQKHPELVAGALASSAPMISGVGQEGGSSDDLSAAWSTDPSSDTGSRQWAYQACTTFGFWQADGWAFTSNLINPSASFCNELFGNVGLANSESYNQDYHFPFISNSATAPSNILFTYGGNDVWTKIGLQPETNANPKIAIVLIRGAGHHIDLNLPTPSDSADVITARNQFTYLAKSWLSQGKGRI
jgi:pimeloyl-ACP methyl ester carboxylesterase